MRELLANVGPKFDHIIIDTPPVLNVTDAVAAVHIGRLHRAGDTFGRDQQSGTATGS